MQSSLTGVAVSQNVPGQRLKRREKRFKSLGADCRQPGTMSRATSNLYVGILKPRRMEGLEWKESLRRLNGRR
jgi:hypothetical protein